MNLSTIFYYVHSAERNITIFLQIFTKEFLEAFRNFRIKDWISFGVHQIFQDLLNVE